MQIWSGLIVDDGLESLKNRAIALENELGIDTLFDFPMHISTKISFKTEDENYEEIVRYLIQTYSSVSEFDVPLSGIEGYDEIVWLRAGESDELERLSRKINSELAERFGVPLHEYDNDYKFHSTLCMGNAPEKTRAFYEGIKNHPFPEKLAVKRAAIALSESGRTHEFKIVETIKLKSRTR